jgi:hypothetical protein
MNDTNGGQHARPHKNVDVLGEGERAARRWLREGRTPSAAGVCCDL